MTTYRTGNHTNGAREALAHVRRQLDGYPHPSEVLVVGQVRRMLDDAAAELGVDEEAPPSRLSAPVSAPEPQTQGSPRAEGAEAISGLCRWCGSRLDACRNCGEPALCGEPWCASCQPENGWTGR